MTITLLFIGASNHSPALGMENALIDQTVMINCGNGSGSGFYLDNTRIITAKHVVTGCSTAEIVSNSKEKTTATNFFLDANLDVAVLVAKKAIVESVITDPKELRQDQTVFIVGSPIDGLVLSKGKVVEANGIDSPNRIYLEIPADHGNSGGPVFSSVGLVGMVTAKSEGGQVIAYNLESLLRAFEKSKKSSTRQEPGLDNNEIDNSTPPLLQFSLILNVLALLVITALVIRLRRNRQIVITLD